jgi:hypothetical protein
MFTSTTESDYRSGQHLFSIDMPSANYVTNTLNATRDFRLTG